MLIMGTADLDKLCLYMIDSFFCFIFVSKKGVIPAQIFFDILLHEMLGHTFKEKTPFL